MAQSALPKKIYGFSSPVCFAQKKFFWAALRMGLGAAQDQKLLGAGRSLCAQTIEQLDPLHEIEIGAAPTSPCCIS